MSLSGVPVGGRLVIVNLQKTPKDKQAALVLHARCDEVMAGIMRHLQRSIPAYVRTDALLVRHVQQPADNTTQQAKPGIPFRVEVSRCFSTSILLNFNRAIMAMTVARNAMTARMRMRRMMQRCAYSWRSLSPYPFGDVTYPSSLEGMSQRLHDAITSADSSCFMHTHSQLSQGTYVGVAVSMAPNALFPW